MASETVENYLKAIYALCEESPAGEATMTRLAASLGVTTGTATSMVKKLNAGKLARYHRYGGVTLTDKGRRTALDVLRRHRLIETFLVEALQLDWAEVHEEAERLEHAVSSRLLDAIDTFLGHPATDPHGDPIPSRSGQLPRAGSLPLAGLAAGTSAVVSRIGNQDKAFLGFVAAHGLRPGSTLRVLASDPAAQSMQVESRGCEPVGIAFPVAARIFAEPAPSPSPQASTTVKRRQPPVR